MIGNNSTGTHSILYGMTADHIKRLEVVFGDGEKLWLDNGAVRLTNLRENIRHLALRHKDEILKRYPQTWRSVAGYALNKIDPDEVNLNWLIAGSEGTLATVVQAELNLVPLPTMSCLAMVHFDSLHAALEATPRILESKPTAVELIDRFMLNLTRKHSEYQKYLTFCEGDPAAILIVEFYGETESELAEQISRMSATLRNSGYRGVITQANSQRSQADVWKIRKAALGLVMSERGDTKALNFVEDAAVPVDQLAAYIADVSDIVSSEGTTFSIYAHASAGCLHVQPLINLKTKEGYRQYRNIASGVANLVIKYHGTISGEHSEGLARGEFSQRLFGPELTSAFKEIKQNFDPENLLNPGKIVDVSRMDDPTLMRFTPTYKAINVQSYFDWSSDGGLNGAAEMCNGSGECRKEDSGTMCPSYMATRNEQHTTRGRANALRLAMAGRLPQGLSDPALKDVFDLCLSCKACKSECPSSVDVARMKPEILANYYKAYGMPLSARLFANIHRLNALASIVPKLSNFLLSSKVGRLILQLLGVSPQRTLPQFSTKRFAKNNTIRTAIHKTPITTLIIDTFTEYNHPEIGEALLKIVDRLDIRVNILRLSNQGCCGRPAISKGHLALSKKMAQDNVRQLGNILAQSPFIFLEPSCYSAFIDDCLTLVDPDLQPIARKVAASCQSAESWLLMRFKDKIPKWDNKLRRILLHGHCHQKALESTTNALALLRSIPNVTVTEIDSGCCGMAGSFGYEHYELSIQIANQRLLPAIAKNPQAVVVSSGTSCRSQIHDAGYAASHPIVVIADALSD